MLRLPLLPLELRFALNSCCRLRPRPSSSSSFSTYAPLLKRKSPSTPQGHHEEQDKIGGVTPDPEKRPEARKALQKSGAEKRLPTLVSTQLVPRSDTSTSVYGRRSVDLPARVLPKAEISPELTLTPKERLQLEWLTRTHPKRDGQKAGFRDQILIYHRGLATSNLIVIGKSMNIVLFFICWGLIGPAYYFHGDPWTTVATILLIGAVPMILFNYVSKPVITWIYLPLPEYARHSPIAAMKYARNLPNTAKLNINFTRATLLPGNVDIALSDLTPIKAGTFRWTGNEVNKGTWYKPNPTEFSARSHSDRGKARRDVVPGIWEHVYKKIMGIESEASSKWKR